MFGCKMTTLIFIVDQKSIFSHILHLSFLSKDEARYGLLGGLAPEDADLKGAPAPLPPRIRVAWINDSDSIPEMKSLGPTSGSLTSPSDEALQFRDPEGLYSSSKPFWAEVSEAIRMTHPQSERKVMQLSSL